MSVIDTMPLVRLVVGCRGRVPMRTELAIRFGDGLVAPWIERDDDVLAVSGPDALRLSTPLDVAERDRCAQADFVVSPGERVPFALTCFTSHERLHSRARRPAAS